MVPSRSSFARQLQYTSINLFLQLGQYEVFKNQYITSCLVVISMNSRLLLLFRNTFHYINITFLFLAR